MFTDRTKKEKDMGHVLTVPEFQHAARIGRDALYSEIRAGRIRAFKSGRKFVIPGSELERYIDRMLRDAPVGPADLGADRG